LFGGLGPVFNQNACESCHIRNGRSAVPQFNGDMQSGLLLKISMPGHTIQGAPNPVPDFGLQLQTKSIFGTVAEGQIHKSNVSNTFTYPDGETSTLHKPIYQIVQTYKPLPPHVVVSARNAPPVFGMGLLEAISISAMQAVADETDADFNGISGKINWVWDIASASLMRGKFGYKASHTTALQQTAGAFNEDMGLTNSYFDAENAHGQSNAQIGLQTHIDVSDALLESAAFYVRTIAVPAARNTTNQAFVAGKQLFKSLNCNACHKEQWITGPAFIPELSHQKIEPYTDLLLHDMGDDLADNRPEFSASGNEWRTAPLWGIGLTQVVNPKATFLHDGRAHTIEEAILWHGGEAQKSKDDFVRLSKAEREKLLLFLKNL